MIGTPESCGECGLPHVRNGKPTCVAHSRGRLRPEITGKPCGMFPVLGSSVCKNHGGKAPQVQAKAEKRVAEAETAASVAKLAATFGDPVLGKDPGEIIADQIAWRYGHVRWLRARVQAIDPTALVWGRTKVKKGGDDFGTTKEAKPNAWLALYLDAQAALEKLCLEAIRAGLEERRVRLAEMQADVLVRVIDGILGDLGLDPNAPATAEVVERHLRVVGE